MSFGAKRLFLLHQGILENKVGVCQNLVLGPRDPGTSDSLAPGSREVEMWNAGIQVISWSLSSETGPTGTSNVVSHFHWCKNLGMSTQRWCFLPYLPGTNVLQYTSGHQLWPSSCAYLASCCLTHWPWVICHVEEKGSSPLLTVSPRIRRQNQRQSSYVCTHSGCSRTIS